MIPDLRRFATDNCPTLTAFSTKAWRLFMLAAGRTSRLLKWAGIVLAVLLVIGLTIHAVLSFCWSRQIDRRLAEIRSHGEPIYAADLHTKKIPDNQNAAIIYKQAFKAYKKFPSSTYDSRDTLSCLFANYPGEEEVSLADLRKLIEQNTEALKLIEKAALCPKCVFQMDEEPSYFTIIPRLSKLITARAVLRARDNRQTDAISDLFLAFKFYDSLEDFPIEQTAFNVRSNALKAALKGLEEIAQQGNLSTAQAEQIYSRLAAIRPDADIRTALINERALLNTHYDSARRDWQYLICVDWAQGYQPSYLDTLPYRLIAFAWRPFSYKDQQISLDLMEQNLKRVHLPYRKLVRLYPNTNARSLPRYVFVAHIYYSLGQRLAAARDSAKANIGLAQVAMALTAYKNTHGSYPKSLDLLKTTPGWRLPHDPFSGKSFIFQRTEKGFLLYSLGTDLKDNGGRAYSQLPKGSNLNAGDIVWTCDE